MAIMATEQAANMRHREASGLVPRRAVIRVPRQFISHFPFSISIFHYFSSLSMDCCEPLYR
jgi:hypothetical protein